MPKFKRELQFIAAISRLEFVAIRIFRSLPHTVNGNQYVTIMTDSYLKLTRAMRTGKTSSSLVANVFFDSWAVPSDIPAYVVTDNGLQFTSKVFKTLCPMLSVKHLTTTASNA